MRSGVTQTIKQVKENRETKERGQGNVCKQEVNWSTSEYILCLVTCHYRCKGVETRQDKKNSNCWLPFAAHGCLCLGSLLRYHCGSDECYCYKHRLTILCLWWAINGFIGDQITLRRCFGL